MDELPDAAMCPVCGLVPASGPGSLVRDPLLATPDARLRALAVEVGIQVFDDLTGNGSDGIGGAAAVVADECGDVHQLVWVAQGLEDGLRADVLAFAIALVADPDDPVGCARASRIGIGAERVPVWDRVGHVAWHLAASCGRVSPSTTFALFEVPDR